MLAPVRLRVCTPLAAPLREGGPKRGGLGFEDFGALNLESFVGKGCLSRTGGSVLLFSFEVPPGEVGCERGGGMRVALREWSWSSVAPGSSE